VKAYCREKESSGKAEIRLKGGTGVRRKNEAKMKTVPFG